MKRLTQEDLASGWTWVEHRRYHFFKARLRWQREAELVQLRDYRRSLQVLAGNKSVVLREETMRALERVVEAHGQAVSSKMGIVGTTAAVGAESDRQL